MDWKKQHVQFKLLVSIFPSDVVALNVPGAMLVKVYTEVENNFN